MNNSRRRSVVRIAMGARISRSARPERDQRLMAGRRSAPPADRQRLLQRPFSLPRFLDGPDGISWWPATHAVRRGVFPSAPRPAERGRRIT
jgi:hypothetical protein